MSCEQLQSELDRQNENSIATLERIKDLEGTNNRIHGELLAERKEKQELLNIVKSLRADLSALSRAELEVEDSSISPTAAENSPLGQRDMAENQRSKKFRKPSRQSIFSALTRIAYTQKPQMTRVVMGCPSVMASQNILDNDKRKILDFIEAKASAVAKYAKYTGAPEDFGIALVSDSRTWRRLVEVHIPAILQSIEKRRKEKEDVSAKWEKLQPRLLEAVEKNRANLLSNLRRALKIDEYGSVEKDTRDAEISRFLNSVGLSKASHDAGIGRVQRYIKSWAKREDKKVSISSPLPVSGIDFEYWVAERLREYGWEAIVSQGSGDQGVDVMATKEEKRLAIQCKLYEGSVGNKAVQEIIAGMSFYDLDRGAVISTGKFTKSARELAHKKKILLLSVQDIPHLNDLL